MMTCNEFIKYVLDTKKVQYDVNLLDNVIKHFFISAANYLEQRIDFDYMFKVFEKTLHNGSSTLTIENLKHTVHVIDRKRKLKLTEDVFDVESAYLLDSGIPTAVRAVGDTLYFNVKAKENIDYVISAYVYSKDIDLNQTHSLLNYSELLYYALATFIDRYYEDYNALAIDNKMLEKLITDTKRNNFYSTGRIGDIKIRVR